MTKNTIEAVKKVFPDYNSSDELYPLALCSTCRLKLKKAPETLPAIMPNFKDIHKSKQTRGKGFCSCNLCILARKKGSLPKTKRGRGAIKQPSHDIASVASIEKKQLVKSKSSVTLCSTCKQEIGKGIKHNCSSSSNNLVAQVQNLPERQKDQIITSLLNQKASSITGKEGSHKNFDMQLSTKGSMSHVTLNPEKKKLMTFSKESILEIQNCLGFSNNTTKKLTHWLRVHGGRKILPPYMRTHVSAAGRTMEDLYTIKWMNFDIGNESKEQRPVFYGKASEVVDFIMDHRQIVDECFVKVMADSGQGSFKISIAIIPNNYDPEIDRPCNNGEPLEKKVRSSYAEGGSCKHGKVSGVKRLIMLANVPDIKETYENCRTLWQLTELDKISYLLSADFKLILTVLGLQTASSMFPCPYCLISLRQLRGQDIEPKDSSCPERTFGTLSVDYSSFIANGSKYSEAKDFHSTIHKSLITESLDVKVLDRVPLPELHLMDCITNYLFCGKVELIDILGKKKAMQWAYTQMLFLLDTMEKSLRVLNAERFSKILPILSHLDF